MAQRSRPAPFPGREVKHPRLPLTFRSSKTPRNEGLKNMPCRSAARTHVGTVRRRNEDAVLERAEIGLWAVADGAGGHERGDYASSRIIAALREVDAVLSGLSLVEEVKERLAEVNREVRARAATIGPNALIGSTVAVLLIWDHQCRCLL